MGFNNISFSKRLDFSRKASSLCIFSPKQATPSCLASSDSRSQSRSSRQLIRVVEECCTVWMLHLECLTCVQNWWLSCLHGYKRRPIEPRGVISVDIQRSFPSLSAASCIAECHCSRKHPMVCKSSVSTRCWRKNTCWNFCFFTPPTKILFISSLLFWRRRFGAVSRSIGQWLKAILV